MDKATGMGKSSAKGSFKLFIGVSISSIFTAVSLILVLRLLGNPDDYGVITTALIVPAMLILFKDWGIDSAMIKYLAQYKSEKNPNAVKSVMASGALFELVTGSLLTLLCFVMADYLATSVFMLPEAKTLIEVASFTIIADSFLKISQSTFVGMEKMEYHSLASILHSVIRLLLAPLLVFLGYSIMGAIQGQIIAQVTAGIIGMVIFYTKFFKKVTKNELEKMNIFGTTKTLLKYGLPLAVAVIANGFLPQFSKTIFTQSFDVVNGASYTTALGNFQTATNFTILITFFTTPISTVLFPAFSKIKGKEEKSILQTVFQSSVKYGALLTIPVTLMIMVLAEPIVFTAVGTEYAEAPFFLTLYSTLHLYVAVGSMSIPAFLNGQGKTGVTMKLNLADLVTGLALSIVLIPQFGVTGLIIANTVSLLPKVVIGLWWINKHYYTKIEWKSSAKIFLASCIATVVTYLVLLQLDFSNWIKLVVGAVTFLVAYLLAAPLIRAVDKKDVRSLREMLSGLGPFSPIFNIPLGVIEKLLDVFNFKRNQTD